MPKSYRRKRTSGRRRRTRKKSRASKRRPFGHTRGKKYGSGFPAPLQLRMRPGGFPPLQTTRLRYCTSFVLNPDASLPGTTTQLSYKAFSTNALCAPHVATFGANTFAYHDLHLHDEAYMHHDDYSAVYSNYRVTGTRCTISVAPEFHDRNHPGVPGDPAVPTYVTLQNSNSLPGGVVGDSTSIDALRGMAKINDMRCDGKRFIKVQPWLLQSGSDVRSSGRQSRTYATTAWSSKWFKHGTDPEFTQSFCQQRPVEQQYFIITAIGGENAESTNPIPVRVQLTLEARVTYWRKRSFNHIPLVDDVTPPQVESTAGPNPIPP